MCSEVRVAIKLTLTKQSTSGTAGATTGFTEDSERLPHAGLLTGSIKQSTEAQRGLASNLPILPISLQKYNLFLRGKYDCIGKDHERSHSP
jgi:hypothetical protein